MEFNLNTILSLGGFAVAVLGLVGTAWWRISVMISNARSETSAAASAASALASMARQELHEHRLHVAETYVSKAGLREVTGQIMDAISGVGTQITEMRARLDKAIDRPNRSKTA